MTISKSSVTSYNTCFIYKCTLRKQYCQEINNFENKLIIPLGKNVNDVLVKLKAENKIKSNLILEGFPHPSGANGHRATQFNLNKIAMKKDIEKWVY